MIPREVRGRDSQMCTGATPWESWVDSPRDGANGSSGSRRRLDLVQWAPASITRSPLFSTELRTTGLPLTRAICTSEDSIER